MNRKTITYVFIPIIITLLLYALSTIGFLSNLQKVMQDSMYGGRPLNNIYIIAIDDKSIQEIGRWPWNRSIIARIIEKLPDTAIIGIDLGFYEKSSEDKELMNAFKNKTIILPIEIHKNYVLRPIFNNTLKGYVNLLSDSDGVVRAINTNNTYKPFSFVIASQYIPLTLEKRNRYLINFIGGKQSFPYISAIDILNNSFNTTKLSDSIILIGVTSMDIHDSYTVPTSINMPGVEIHANLVQQFMTRKTLRTQSKESLLLLILLSSIITLIIIHTFKPHIALILSLFLIILYELIAIITFRQGIIMNTVYPPLSIITTFIITYAYFYIVEEKEKKVIRNIFSKYVSKEVLEELLRQSKNLKLGGEEKEIVILFSDIRGFTTLSEKLSPQRLVSFLNYYLSEMSEIIMKNKGVVNKYIGDAIMSIWGAPLRDKNKEINACKTAIEMIKKLQEIKKRTGFDIGIGIHKGRAIVGNIGSINRFEYTAIGDSVNTASRLEGLTKHYGVKIIISQPVREKIKNIFITRELDQIIVKGKTEPLRIYELIGYKEEISKETKELINMFEKALGYYYKGEFRKAKTIFLKLSRKGDKPSLLFLKRIEKLLNDSSLRKNWKGVWTMKEK